MNNTEQALKIVRDLEDELEALNGRAALLTKQRQELAFAVRAGDKGAKEKLTKTSAEASTIATDIEIIIAALVEAKSRLGTAEAIDNTAADQATAVKIQEVQKAFYERMLIIQDACEDIAKYTNENKVLLSELHRLGCTAPSHDSVRINCVNAIKTLLNALPWSREFELKHGPSVLAPNERKQFKDLAATWNNTIENQIAHRLPKKEAA